VVELHLRVGLHRGRTSDSSAIRLPWNDKEKIRVRRNRFCERPSDDYSFFVLSKDFSHGVGDFAYRGVGFDGGHDMWH